MKINKVDCCFKPLFSQARRSAGLKEISKLRSSRIEQLYGLAVLSVSKLNVFFGTYSVAYLLLSICFCFVLDAVLGLV